MKILANILTFVPKSCLNRYFLIGMSFMVYVNFFSDYGFIDSFKQMDRLENLESMRTHYTDAIDQVAMEKEALFGNDAALERFAREKYFMKKSNEDIFVIVQE